MKTDNQSKGKGYLVKLGELLERSYAQGTIEVENGSISRTWVRSKLGCGQNWPNQNPQASDLIMEFEKKLQIDVKKTPRKISPGVTDREVKLILARIDRLEQKNAHLIDENNKYKQALFENGWLDSDELESQQGKLPW